MNLSQANERRHCQRMLFRSHANLVTPHHTWPVHVIDISFNGALVALIQHHHLDPHEEIMLNLEVGKNEHIKMQGRIAHQKEHYIGLECFPVDDEQKARLQELVRRLEPVPEMDRSLNTLLNG